MGGHQVTLSAAQKDIVRRLAGEGKSGTQIAAVIGGITRGAAIAVARRMGVKLHGALRGSTWTPERVAELGRLWRMGLSSIDIAERMGITQKAVLQRRCVLKLPKRSLHEMNRRIRRGAVARRAEMQQAKPPVIPRERPLPPTSEPVSLLNRREDQCAWVIGETRGPNTMFCGAPAADADCWCAYHASIGRIAPYVRSLRIQEWHR